MCSMIEQNYAFLQNPMKRNGGGVTYTPVVTLFIWQGIFNLSDM